MPMLNTKTYKNLDGIGTLVSDIILQLLRYMAEDERTRMNTAAGKDLKCAILVLPQMLDQNYSIFNINLARNNGR